MFFTEPYNIHSHCRCIHPLILLERKKSWNLGIISMLSSHRCESREKQKLQHVYFITFNGCSHKTSATCYIYASDDDLEFVVDKLQQTNYSFICYKNLMNFICNGE